jgi:hypothetical protein
MHTPVFLRVLLGVALVGLAAAPRLPAQMESVPLQPAPGLTEVVVPPAPGEHIVEIELAVSKGSVQAYFGRAARREKIELGGAELSIKMPSSATVTKIVSRDDDSTGSKKVTPDNPWIVRAPFNGAGRYVFNIQEWDDDPVVTAAVVKVDGAVMFSGRGSEDDFNGWAQKSYAPEVSKSGSREIAFILP